MTMLSWYLQLCKIDADGEPRKIGKCSSVVITVSSKPSHCTANSLQQHSASGCQASSMEAHTCKLFGKPACWRCSICHFVRVWCVQGCCMHARGVLWQEVHGASLRLLSSTSPICRTTVRRVRHTPS